MRVVKTAELCKELGYGAAWVGRLHKRGMPQIKRGTWDLDACREWIESQKEGTGDATKELTAARVRVQRLQGDKLEMDLAASAREVIPHADVAFAFDQAAVIIRSNLDTWTNDARSSTERDDRQRTADAVLAAIGSEFAAVLGGDEVSQSSSAA